MQQSKSKSTAKIWVMMLKDVSLFFQAVLCSLFPDCPIVLFFDRGHPCFRSFNLTSLLMLLGYGDSFLDPTCVPIRISINKLDLVPNWIVAGAVGMFRNGGGLGMGESYIPVMLLHRSPCFCDLDFAALAGNPVNYILFSWVDSVLWSN